MKNINFRVSMVCNYRKILLEFLFVILLIPFTGYSFASETCNQKTVPNGVNADGSQKYTTTEECVEEIQITGIRAPDKEDHPLPPKIDWSIADLLKSLDPANKIPSPQPDTSGEHRSTQNPANTSHSGCPVLYDSGNKMFNEVDYVGTGDMPLNIVRNYNSGNDNNYFGGPGIFGPRSVSKFDIRLRINYSDGSICYTNSSASPLTCNGATTANYQNPKSVKDVTLIQGLSTENFVSNPNGALRPSQSSKRRIDPITKTPDIYGNYITGFNYYDEDGMVYEFNDWGRLKTITNANGISWAFTYEAFNITGQVCSNCTAPQVLTKVTHSSGRQLNFTWSQPTSDTQYQPVVASVVLPNGKSIVYSRNVFNKLTVSQPDGTGSKTYDNPSGNITAQAIDGVQWGDYAYYTASPLKVQYSGMVGGINRSTFEYTSNTTKVTNAKGGINIYSYDANHRLVGVNNAASDVCPSADSVIHYASAVLGQNNIDYKEDWKGNRTAYTYYPIAPTTGVPNPTGDTNNIQYEYANGITKEYTWDDYGRLTSQKIWDGAKNSAMCKTGAACPAPRSLPAVVTEYIYNSSATFKNRLQYLNTKALKYNSNVYTAVRTTTFSYEFYNNNIVKKVTIDGPQAGAYDQIIKEYNTSGDLLKVTNAKGDFSQFFYETNNSGLINKIINTNGLVTDLMYDAKGRLIKSTINDGTPKITNLEYYGDDQIKKITYPNGGYISYGLDTARRISSITRPDEIYNSQVTNMTYDLINDLETVKNSVITNGVSQLSTVSKDNIYDAFGNLKQSKGQNSQYVSYTYDANQNVTTATDALGRVTRFTYNAANQIETSVNPLLETTNYHYDSLGNLAEVIDGRANITNYHRNGFGDVEEMNSPDTGKTTYQYTDAGQLSYTIKANNVRVDYTYDLLGRIQTLISSGSTRNETATYYYDATASGSSLTCANGKGKLCGIVDSSGSTNYSYSLSGNIVAQQQVIAGTNYTISNTYDAYGRLDEITYPDGTKTKNIYDINNNVKQVQAYVAGVWQSVVSKKPYYNREELTFGNGIIRNKNFDTDGRVTSISASNQSLAYGYKLKTDLIATLTNSSNSAASLTLGYDDADRLITNTSTTTAGATDNYFYDKNGNRKLTKLLGTTTPDNTYFTPTVNNILSTRNVSGNVGWKYQYNLIGNLTSKSTAILDSNGNVTNTLSNLFTADYDGFGRMAYYLPSGVGKLDYYYNAFNQRVYKFRANSSSGGEPTNVKYLYSPSGLLLGEYATYGNASTVVSVYVYLDGEVIGLIRNNQIYSVQNDHLSRPEVIANSSKTIMWRATNSAFDRSVTTDNIGTFNIGFPGQYYDKESALWYNWNRYYDASIGRYLQSDPIGLDGGLNTYVYALNNPVRFIDPMGLETPSISLLGQPSQGSLRSPDFVTFQLDGYVLSASATYTRYGDVFLGKGVSRPYPSLLSGGVSISAGWFSPVNDPCKNTKKDSKDDRKKLNGFLDGWGAGAGGYGYIGGSLSGNSAGSALNLGVGFGGFSANVGSTNSYQGNIFGDSQ